MQFQKLAPRFPFIVTLSIGFLASLATADEKPFTKKARNTQTGKTFEAAVQKTLIELGYEVTTQQQVGTRPNGSRHLIDLIAKKEKRSLLISLKWQQSSGTAEQKIPYEVICLSEALKQARGTYHAAYLVLGGEGWTLKKFYLSGGLDRHLNLQQEIKILSPEDLLARAKNGKL